MMELTVESLSTPQIASGGKKFMNTFLRESAAAHRTGFLLLTGLCLLTTTGCASMLGTLANGRDAQPADFQDEPFVSQPAVESQPAFEAQRGSYALQQQSEAAPFGVGLETLPVRENPVAASADAQLVTQATGVARVGVARPTANPFAATEQTAIQQVGFSAAAESGLSSTFRPADPRLPSSQFDGMGPPPGSVIVAGSPLVQAFPDEYIFDGGDRDTPVHYNGSQMAGLDTEDTVAEFQDHLGDNHVRASNRVAVYAPRFGAVETVTGPGIDVQINRAAGAVDVAGLEGLHEKRGLEVHAIRTPASGMAVRRSASGIETTQPLFQNQNTEGAMQNSKVDQGLESKMALGLQRLNVTREIVLSVAILEPVRSETRTALGLAASTSQATQVYATFRAQALTGSEEGGEKGDIHITKEASVQTARAGDTITFRIHFRNTGDYNVDNVRIIDNLTPRLQYVDGTGRIQMPNGAGGDLLVLPNQDGSQLLQFELDQPLKGGQGGVITFQAKVL